MGQTEFRVGTGAMVFKDGKVLLGKTKASNTHKEGEFCFPGGHLEHNESLVSATKREAKEEAGVEIDNVNFFLVMNITEYDPLHYIGFGFTADWKSGEPKVMEPDKFESWDWYDVNNLPTPIYEPSRKFVEAYKNKINFVDA